VQGSSTLLVSRIFFPLNLLWPI